MHYRTTLLCLALAHAASATPTPDGGFDVTCGCRYRLYDIEVNWIEASELCTRNGLQLATFSNENEYNELVKLIKEKRGNSEGKFYYWVGGSDLAKKGSWVWHPNSSPLSYYPWYPGEPSHGGAADNEHCLHLRSDYGYKMNDVVCTFASYVACQYKIASDRDSDSSDSDDI